MINTTMEEFQDRNSSNSLNDTNANNRTRENLIPPLSRMYTRDGDASIEDPFAKT